MSYVNVLFLVDDKTCSGQMENSYTNFLLGVLLAGGLAPETTVKAGCCSEK